VLHVPIGSNSFGATESSVGTTRPNAAQGTSVTPAVGSKGSWAQMIASTAQDSYGIIICINSNYTASASRNSVIDIGIGASSSETVLIPDLIGGNAATYALGGQYYYFPLLIPAGTRISARSQSSVTTALRVYAQLLQQPINPAQIRKGSFVEAIGVSLPGGASVTAGTTNKGSWVSLGTTTNKVWWWQLGVQVNTADVSHSITANHVDLAVGNATNKQIIIADLNVILHSNEYTSNPPLSAGVEYPVPAGTEVYARAQCSGTADPLNVVAYALGG